MNKFNDPYVPNPYAPEISDEYFINEIIGIDEIRYEDFIKKDKPKKQTHDPWLNDGAEEPDFGKKPFQFKEKK